jgi:hypothetical protein
VSLVWAERSFIAPKLDRYSSVIPVILQSSGIKKTYSVFSMFVFASLNLRICKRRGCLISLT